MNIVAVETRTTFDLGKDIFVISKMKAKFGGAFSNTKLTFSEKNRGLKKEEVQFVTTYFAALALQKIKNSRTILDAAGERQTCSGRRLQARRLWQSHPDSHTFGVYYDEINDEEADYMDTSPFSGDCKCSVEGAEECCFISTPTRAFKEYQPTYVRRCTAYMKSIGRC